MKLISSSQMLVIGSHIDELLSKKDFRPFINYVASMEKLRESCEAVVDKNDKISYHCHCLNSYLQQLEQVSISLDELCSGFMELNEPCLSFD